MLVSNHQKTERMKNKISYSLAVIGMLVVASCNKDSLNPVPPTAISNISSFSTPDRVLNQTRALYANFRSGQFYGGRYTIYNDVRAEDFLNETTNGVTGLEVWNHTLRSEEHTSELQSHHE